MDWAQHHALQILNGVFGLAGDLMSRAGFVPGGAPQYLWHPDEPPARELVAFTRRLRSDATPQILAQHLVITKHWPTNEIDWPTEIALKSFISTLVSFDDMFAAEEAKKRTADAPAPRPVPIEDTTLELTDAPGDTW
jgi:hypothetical protein